MRDPSIIRSSIFTPCHTFCLIMKILAFSTRLPYVIMRQMWNILINALLSAILLVLHNIINANKCCDRLSVGRGYVNLCWYVNSLTLIRWYDRVAWHGHYIWNSGKCILPIKIVDIKIYPYILRVSCIDKNLNNIVSWQVIHNHHYNFRVISHDVYCNHCPKSFLHCMNY